MKNMRDLGLGVLLGVALMFTLGASTSNNKEIVRYQISSYGMGRSHGVYIVDTQTGVVKHVFQGRIDEVSKGGQLGTPFNKMRNNVY